MAIFSAAQLEALREHAHNAVEDRDHEGGWAIAGVEPDPPVNGCVWTWEDMRVLWGAGLLERRDEWKDILVRPTAKGWQVLRGE